MSTKPHYTIHRDQGLEHRRTLEAIATSSVKAQTARTLTQHARERAGGRGVDDLLYRDLGMEALEELADCRNYLLWMLLQLDYAAPSPNDESDPGVDARVTIEDALRHVVSAYEYALEARPLVACFIPDRAPALQPPTNLEQESREAAAWRALRAQLSAHALGARTASQVAAAGLNQMRELAELPEEASAA